MAIRKQPENRLSQTNKQQTDQIKSIHSKSQSTEGERTWDMNGAILVTITFALGQFTQINSDLLNLLALLFFCCCCNTSEKKKNLASQDLAVTHTFSHISHTIRTVCNHLTMETGEENIVVEIQWANIHQHACNLTTLWDQLVDML